MSNIANIVLTTTLGTEDPVTHTFGPNGFPAQDTAEYFDRAIGVPVGFSRIRIVSRRPTATSDAKVSVQLDVPTLAETSPSTSSGISPGAVRAYNCIAKLDFFLPRSSSQDERDVLLQLLKGLAASTVVAEAVKDLNFPY